MTAACHLLVSFTFLLGLVALSGQAAAAGDQQLRFTPAGTNGFTFDTGVLRGKLQADGKSKGLSAVVHIPTGVTLDSSLGLFSHYRVFTTNHRYGTAAWDWPSEAELKGDGSVAVRWPAAADRPFELRALYRWASADTLELETTVVAKTNLMKFESFLASYFSDCFTNSAVWGRPGGEMKPRLINAEKSYGQWLAFPSDLDAIAIIQDGRWKFAPSPVEWTIMPRFVQPLGVRRCAGSRLEAVLMVAPKDCFAIMTPQQTDPHRSMYFSLFGRDLRTGETAHARARLVIRKLPSGDPAKLLGDFLRH